MPDANFFGKKKVFPCNNYFYFIILSSSFRLRLGKILKFFGFFKKIFPLFAFSSNETILFCKFIRNTSVKKTATTKNQQNKTKAADWFYFSSITSRINLEFSIYLCLSYIQSVVNQFHQVKQLPQRIKYLIKYVIFTLFF